MCSQITTVGIDWKTLSFEKSHTFDGYVFATANERCRYIGLLLRDRPRWLREHPDRWRRIADVQQEAAPPAPPVESEIDLGAEPAGREVSLPTPTKALLPAHEPALVTPPAVIGPQAVSTRDEIIIDGRRLISERRVAAMLKVSKRTLQRWRQENKGPPRVKIGRRIYYDEDKLKLWIQDR